MRIFILLPFFLFFVGQVDAAPSRMDLAVNILRQFQAEVDIRDGGICVFKDAAKPFSQRVMLDCESFLNELLVDHDNFKKNSSPYLLDSLFSYAEAILGSLYTEGVFVLPEEKESEAIIVARILIYVSQLNTTQGPEYVSQRIFDFYNKNKNEINPILESLKDEQTVSKLILVLNELNVKEKDDQINLTTREDLVEKLDVATVPVLEAKVEDSVSPIETSKNSSLGYYVALGLMVILVGLVGWLRARNLNNGEMSSEIFDGMTKEERAELRELRYYFGVSNNVSLSEISKLYRSKVREVHPDSGGNEVEVFLNLQLKYNRIKTLQEKFLKAKNFS
jgi:hypothetical protein